MAQSAYVFIYLSGQVQPTIAGRFDLEEDFSPAVGRFVYAESYLSNPSAVPLDPIALPLKAQQFTTTLSSGFFGVFRDAIPDDWGRHVAAKLYGNQFETDFDYLWLNTGDRIGALAFGRTPQTPVDEKPLLEWEQLRQTPMLDAIQRIDRNVILTAAQEEAIHAFGAGTSAGGARPKLTVRKPDGIWLVKLNRHNDRFNVVRVEAATLDLASACGIEVSEHEVHQIHGHDVLAIRRFDRELTDAGVLRHRMVSATTVGRADEAVAQYTYAISYPRLSLELARWTNTANRDRRELFRRVAFNSLTSVTDDHERNHALIAPRDHFRLSPAFDLIPQPSNTQRRFLALVVGDFGALAVRQNLLSSAEQFQLSLPEANAVIDQVQKVVRTQWRNHFNNRGVSATDVDRVAGCFDPPGFEADPPVGM
jgi:serine/threonine-protein kinase HipA